MLGTKPFCLLGVGVMREEQSCRLSPTCLTNAEGVSDGDRRGKRMNSDRLRLREYLTRRIKRMQSKNQPGAFASRNAH